MSWFGFGGAKKDAGRKYNERDLKVQCKSAVIRLQLRRQKIRNLIKQQRREIAGLLKAGEDENARILVEQIIKDEYKCDAYDELEVYCEELVARLNLISMSKRLPQELTEPICTLIWTALRTDVKELNSIRELLAAKFGQNLDHEALCNVDNCVNAKVMERLGPEPPEEVMVFSFLNSIAEEYDLDWRAVEAKEIPDDDPLAGLEEESIDFSSMPVDLDTCLPSVPGSSSESVQRSTGWDDSLPNDLISMSEPALQHAQPMVAPVLHQVTDIGAKGVPSSVDDFESMFAAVPSTSSSSRSTADEFFGGGPPVQQPLQMPSVPSMGGAFDVVPPMGFGLPPGAAPPGGPLPSGMPPGGAPPGGYPGAGVLQMPTVPTTRNVVTQDATRDGVSSDPPNLTDAELEAEFEKLMQLSPRDSDSCAAVQSPSASTTSASPGSVLGFPSVPQSGSSPAIDFPSLPVDGTAVQTTAEYGSLFDDEPQPVSNPSLTETVKSLGDSLGRAPAPDTSGQAAPIKLPGMPSLSSSTATDSNHTIEPSMAPGESAVASTRAAAAPAEPAAWQTVEEPSHSPPPPQASDSNVPEDWASKFGLDVSDVQPHSSAMGSWAALDPQAGPQEEPQLSSQELASTLQEDDMDDLFARLSALKKV